MRTYEPSNLVVSCVKIAIQINGKLREVLEIAKDEDDEVVKNLVLNNESIKNRLQGLTIRKVIVVKNKIVNIVAN